jgi:NAD-dependent dihydropyrimidine dehydrogenase PreA subunit
MKEKKILPSLSASAFCPITFDPDLCDGCNRCVEVCQVDIFTPNPQRGKPPQVSFPDECWYNGCCVDICPKPGAIKLNIPLMNRVNWKKKK